MAKKSTKTIFLRAFEIANPDPTRKSTNLIKHMTERLKNSHVSDRKMLINSLDESAESDVIPDFSFKGKIIKGAIMRIIPKEEVPSIPDNLLSKEKFSVEELGQIESKSSVIYKSHYYFAASDTHIVTNLLRTTTIRGFQTYLNWLLEEQRDNFLYELTPAIKVDEQIHLSDVNKISITDQDRSKKTNKGAKESVSQQKKALRNLVWEEIKKMITDSKDLDAIKNKQIISAELLIKFAKPKDMSDSDYKKALGAIIKPMSDTDNTTFHTRSGKVRSASDLIKMKPVDIDLTESGKPSEQQIYQEMEKYLSEL